MAQHGSIQPRNAALPRLPAMHSTLQEAGMQDGLTYTCLRFDCGMRPRRHGLGGRGARTASARPSTHGVCGMQRVQRCPACVAWPASHPLQ